MTQLYINACQYFSYCTNFFSNNLPETFKDVYGILMKISLKRFQMLPLKVIAEPRTYDIDR